MRRRPAVAAAAVGAPVAVALVLLEHAQQLAGLLVLQVFDLRRQGLGGFAGRPAGGIVLGLLEEAQDLAGLRVLQLLDLRSRGYRANESVAGPQGMLRRHICKCVGRAAIHLDESCCVQGEHTRW